MLRPIATMIQQDFLLLLGLIGFLGKSYAQFPCGTPLPLPVSDSKTYGCAMQETSDKCNKIMLIITGFPRATGTGGSVATPASSGSIPNVECHITIKKGLAILICSERGGEQYRLDLGPSSGVESVLIALSRRAVTVNVHKFSLTLGQNRQSRRMYVPVKKIPYVISASFPIKESSGFCTHRLVRYKPNGSLYKINDGKRNKVRSGSGYTVLAYQAKF